MSVRSTNQNLRVYVSPASAAIAPSGGSLFNLDLATGAGAAGTGTVTISGAAGSVDSVKVDGVELLSAAVPFNTDINTTAADVASNISANVSVPDYNAAAVATNVITITADAEGPDFNGVITTELTTLTSVNVNITGGVGDGFPLGAITYLNHTTQAHVAVMPLTAPFNVVYKAMDGNIYHGPTIKPAEIESSKLGVASVAPVQQVSNITVTATASTDYVLRLSMQGYGGLIGANEEINFYGTHFNPASGGTATTIADALVASLQAALAKAPSTFVTVSNVAGKITITGVAQPYERAKLDGRQVNFKVSLAAPEAQWAGADADSTPPVPGRGQYNQVAAMEEFYAGYSRGYANRDADWPNNLTPSFAAVAGNTYKSDTVIFASTEARANLGSQRQIITCFFQE